MFAQTTAPSAAPTTVPVPAAKRVTCLATTQNLEGQDKRDQMQLCMAQAEAGDRSEGRWGVQEEFHQEVRRRRCHGAVNRFEGPVGGRCLLCASERSHLSLIRLRRDRVLP